MSESCSFLATLLPTRGSNMSPPFDNCAKSRQQFTVCFILGGPERSATYWNRTRRGIETSGIAACDREKSFASRMGNRRLYFKTVADVSSYLCSVFRSGVLFLGSRWLSPVAAPQRADRLQRLPHRSGICCRLLIRHSRGNHHIFSGLPVHRRRYCASPSTGTDRATSALRRSCARWSSGRSAWP